MSARLPFSVTVADVRRQLVPVIRAPHLSDDCTDGRYDLTSRVAQPFADHPKRIETRITRREAFMYLAAFVAGVVASAFFPGAWFGG